MRIFWAAVVVSVLLLACEPSTPDSTETSQDIAPQSDQVLRASPSNEIGVGVDEESVNFQDVLVQYQAINARVERIAYALQKSNAKLCPVTERSIGIHVHNVFDYPESLQPIARVLLPVSEDLSLRVVRPGSPADVGGYKPGDEIVEIGGVYLPKGSSSKTLYSYAAPTLYTQDHVSLKVTRGPDTFEKVLAPEIICGYPVSVFYSERINGHTDGKDVWVTSELVRSEPNDSSLALVIAHEMAHAIAGHAGAAPSKQIELEADRIALVMMARADFDIDSAVENWKLFPHPHGGNATHPTPEERLLNFQAVQARIDAAKKAGRDLTLDLL